MRSAKCLAIPCLPSLCAHLSALSRPSWVCSASSMVGTMKRAIRNCDCCALEPAPAAPPTVPGTLHTPPTPVDTIGNEEEAAIGPSRPPAFSVMIVWFGLACVAPIALLLTPVAFGAEDTTAGCCCRLGSRSNCWRAALKHGGRGKNENNNYWFAYTQLRFRLMLLLFHYNIHSIL